MKYREDLDLQLFSEDISDIGISKIKQFEERLILSFFMNKRRINYA
jgi:hypothetical protein